MQEAFKDKDYGASISKIGIVMTCMAKDLMQRKRFKKDAPVSLLMIFFWIIF